MSARQLRVLADAVGDLGTGELELTSRGNVQIRGLVDGAELELGHRLAAAGLLPSPSHERVRNVVASPLAGLDATSDLTSAVEALDRGLCADPQLAQLPGRFLFALDDGRGDVAALGADVTGVRTADGAWVEGVAVPDVVAAMLAVARAFLAERVRQGSEAWRVDELPSGRGPVIEQALGARPGPMHRSSGRVAGSVRQTDGRTALVVLAPLGRLQRAQLDVLADTTGPRGVRITPWRSVVLPDLEDATSTADALAGTGLGVDADSRWFGLSACAGRPGCAKSLADVRADASADAGHRHGKVVHWSGCERRCGRPHDTAVDVVATAEGYRISE